MIRIVTVDNGDYAQYKKLENPEWASFMTETGLAHFYSE